MKYTNFLKRVRANYAIALAQASNTCSKTTDLLLLTAFPASFSQKKIGWFLLLIDAQVIGTHASQSTS